MAAQELKDGPLSQKRIVREAKEYGFSYGTLRRAKEELKLRSKRIEFGAGISYWAWVLDRRGSKGSKRCRRRFRMCAPTQKPRKNRRRSRRRASQTAKMSPSAFELQEYLAGLGPDLDEATLTRMMTPAMVTKLIKERRGLGGGQPAASLAPQAPQGEERQAYLQRPPRIERERERVTTKNTKHTKKTLASSAITTDQTGKLMTGRWPCDLRSQLSI